MEEDCQIYHCPKGSNKVQKMIYKSDWKIVNAKKILNKRGGIFRDLKIEENHERTLSEMKTLFDQCIDFIAENAEFLDSLECFPLQIGEKIWKSCIRNSLALSPVILQTFCTAYPDEILTNCKLSDIFVVNNYEEQIKVLLTNCLVIDLSHCHLDECHDLLLEMPQRCQKLQNLNLSGNKLTSKTLRLMFGLPEMKKNSFPK